LLGIAYRSEVTGVPWRSLSRFYEIPADLRGVRTLDVCSGMSDFAYRLQQQGAQAHALDFAYHDLAGMTSRHRENFDATCQDVFGAEPGSQQAEALYGSFVQGFMESLTTLPSIYVAGSATALPFRSNSFDLVTSFNGLFGALDFDLDVLAAALREAIRVVKRGGCVQVIPFQAGPILNDAERQIQRAAVEVIARTDAVELSKAVARDEPLLGGRVTRLTIRKTSG
jgi:ubiquinone/menaquinone biosynthesis C-methylase UbiE